MGFWRRDRTYYALIEYRMDTDRGPGEARDVVPIRAPSLKKAAEKASRLRPTAHSIGSAKLHGGTAILVGVYTAEQLEGKLRE